MIVGGKQESAFVLCLDLGSALVNEAVERFGVSGWNQWSEQTLTTVGGVRSEGVRVRHQNTK